MTGSSERFHQLLVELGELHDKKQEDYGTDEDPFANVRATSGFGIEPWVGSVIRLNDKVQRLKSMVRNGRLANESVEDSLRDIAVYAIIGLVLYEELQSEKPTDEPSLVRGKFEPGVAVTECVVRGKPCHDHCTCDLVIPA